VDPLIHRKGPPRSGLVAGIDQGTSSTSRATGDVDELPGNSPKLLVPIKDMFAFREMAVKAGGSKKWPGPLLDRDQELLDLLFLAWSMPPAAKGRQCSLWEAHTDSGRWRRLRGWADPSRKPVKQIGIGAAANDQGPAIASPATASSMVNGHPDTTTITKVDGLAPKPESAAENRKPDFETDKSAVANGGKSNVRGATVQEHKEGGHVEKTESPPAPAFLPSSLQAAILTALKGTALTADELEFRLHVDRRTLFYGSDKTNSGKDGLKQLMQLGLVINNRRVGGYYRPDFPPENLLKAMSPQDIN
jgi:hypothetical protein